jgi:hypothetical protein
VTSEARLLNETASSAQDEALRDSVRTRLQLRYGADRAAALFGYWQLLAAAGGPTRLRGALGADGYRSALAALAAAGVDVPRQTGPGPAAGTEAQPGAGASANLTVERQLLRQALLRGLFAWGDCSGQLDLSFVRGGAPGYTQDTIVVGLVATRLLPATYHRVEVRAAPSLLEASPPVLLRLGGHADATGKLWVFAGQPAASDSAETVAIFAGPAGQIEAVLYRCYDGPAGEDASFAIARGVFG